MVEASTKETLSKRGLFLQLPPLDFLKQELEHSPEGPIEAKSFSKLTVG